MDRGEYDVVVVQQPESGNLLDLTNSPPPFSGNACILSHEIPQACLPHPLPVHLASFNQIFLYERLAVLPRWDIRLMKAEFARPRQVARSLSTYVYFSGHVHASYISLLPMISIKLINNYFPLHIPTVS